MISRIFGTFERVWRGKDRNRHWRRRFDPCFQSENSGDGLRLVDRIGSMLPDLSSIVEGDTADSALAHL